MSSPKWPEVLGPDAERALLEAVTAVAEQSFFAVVEPCDTRQFAQLERDAARWLVAAIPFTDADCRGELRCTVSEDLAVALFDAFTGREPLGPPRAEELLDLLGEFANMACGSWLTHRPRRTGFTLGPPSVKWMTDASRPSLTLPHLLLAINDLPLVLDVRATPAVTVPV